MRINKDISTLYRFVTASIRWCLFASTFGICFIVNAEDSVVAYDSSIQRSDFLTTSTEYEDNLLKQIEDRRSTLLWKFRFDSESLSTNQNQQSQSVGATVGTKFKYKIVENLSFNAKANLNLQSGRSQSVFGDLEPDSGIYPRELKLDYTVLDDTLSIGFGQIHQRWLNEQLFIGGLGFPGVAEKYQYKTDRLRLKVIAQQLIPTSSTLSTRVSERESLPNLFTESIEATYKLSTNNFIFGRVTHFKYSQLPSVVAARSYIYGNSVNTPDPNNGEFIYGFQGFMYQVTFEQKISNSLSAQVNWNTIVNNDAPSERGEAQRTRLIVANDFGRWIIAGEASTYFIESDAVPAFYNSHRLGHNNRIGQEFGLVAESKDWGVIFRANYVDANLLNNSAFDLQQNDQQTFYFAVETLYDFI